MEESKNTTQQPGLFEKGGKLGFLHSTVDAFDTFLVCLVLLPDVELMSEMLSI